MGREVVLTRDRVANRGVHFVDITRRSGRAGVAPVELGYDDELFAAVDVDAKRGDPVGVDGRVGAFDCPLDIHWKMVHAADNDQVPQSPRHEEHPLVAEAQVSCP